MNYSRHKTFFLFFFLYKLLTTIKNLAQLRLWRRRKVKSSSANNFFLFFH